MKIRTYSYNRTGFEKPDGSFYEFDDIDKANLGCGSCKIYSDKSKESLIMEGYCLDGEYICPITSDSELKKNATLIEEMFKRLKL